MKPSWAAVTSTPEYQALPFAQQQRAREDFFKQYIAPAAPPEYLDKIASSWDEQTNPVYGAKGSGTPADPFDFGNDEDRATSFLDKYPEQSWVRAPSGDVMSKNTSFLDDPLGYFRRGVAQAKEGLANMGPSMDLNEAARQVERSEAGGHWGGDMRAPVWIPADPELADPARRDQLTALTEIASNRQQATKERGSVPRSYEASALEHDTGEAKGFVETIGAIAKHPGAAFGQASESIVSVLPGLTVAAVTRNPALAAVAMGINSGGMEYSSGVADYLQQQGIDLNDEDAIAGLSQGEINKALSFAKTRAAIIGTIDAATGGLIAKNIIPTSMVQGFARREAANMVAQTGVDMGAGAGGELLGQVATGSKRDWNAIVMEAMGEGLTKPAELASHIYARAKGDFDLPNLPSNELATQAASHPDMAVRMASVMELANRGEQIDLDKISPLKGRESRPPLTPGAAAASSVIDTARSIATPIPTRTTPIPTSEKPRLRLTPEQAAGAPITSPVLEAAAKATGQPVGAIAPTAPTLAPSTPGIAPAPAQTVMDALPVAPAIQPVPAAPDAQPVVAPQSPPAEEAEVDSFLDQVVASGEQAGYTAPELIQPTASLAAPPASAVEPMRSPADGTRPTGIPDNVVIPERPEVPLRTRAPLNLRDEAGKPAQRASGTPALEVLYDHVKRKIESDLADSTLLPIERGQAKKALASLRRTSITEVRLSGTNAARKGVLENVIGKRIVFLSATNADGTVNPHVSRLLSSTAGFFMPDSTGTLYVNADSPGGKSPMAIIGHEFLHSLREHAPDLYNEFAAFSKSRTTRDPKVLSEHKGLWDGDSSGRAALSDDSHAEEMNADFFGDMFNDEAFWKELAKRDPGKFKRVMKSILDFLDSLLHKAGLQSEELFTDLAAMREKAADIFMRYSNEYVQHTPEQTEAVRQQNKADDLRDMGFEADPDSEIAEQMMWSPGSSPLFDNPSFVAWFGNSKAVTKSGKPLKLYHGTGSRFDTFDSKKLSKYGGNYGAAFYFTPDKDAAGYHAYEAANEDERKQVIMPVYLSIQNPIDAKGYNEIASKYPSEYPREPGERWSASKSVAYGAKVKQQIIDDIKALGHDGIVISDTENMLDEDAEWIVFDANQIKSSSKNNGEYSKTDNNIYRSPVRTSGSVAPVQDIKASRVRPTTSAQPPVPPRSPISNNQLVSPLGPTNKAKAWAAKKGGNLERTWLDQFRDLRVVQEWAADTTGNPLPPWAQPWRQENLRHGAFVDARDRAMTKFFEPVAKMLEANKYDRHEFEDFLWARHAEERDTYLRSKLDPKVRHPGPADLAGMSPADARAFMASLDPKKLRTFTRAAQFMDGLRRHTLNVLVDSGQISDAHRGELLSQYEHYVPLRGLPDGADPDISNSGLGTGKGLSVSSSPLGKRAQGRVTPPSDILEEMKKDLERALIGAEKQKVLKQLVSLIALAPDKSLWEVSPIVPHRKWVNGVLTVVDTTGELRDQVVYMHNGKPVKIELRDHNLKAALLGMNSPEQLGVVMTFTAKVVRILSAVKTSLNPYFIFPNVARDAQFALIGLSVEQGKRVMKTAAKNYLPAFRALYRDNKSMKAVRNGGVMVKWAREFAAQGGKTGYTLANDIETQRHELNDLFVKNKRTDLASLSLRDIHKAKVIAADWIENINSYAENATRLAVYSAMRENGIDAKTAAAYAKDVTVNFNRKGTAARKMSALYLFFNPAVQGSRRMLKLSKSPVALAIFGGIAVASYGVTLFQMIQMGDDDDGENKYEKLVGDRTAHRALVLALSDENTLTIPMPYGPNIFGYLGHVLAKAHYRQMTGKPINGGQLTKDFLGTAVASMSPIDPGKGWEAVTPEPARIVLNLANNKNDFGGKINYSLVDTASTPTNRPNFKLSDPKTADLYVETAKALNLLTGGGKYDGGLVNPTAEHIKYATEQALGGPAKLVAQSWALAEKYLTDMPIAPGDVPVSNTFWRTNRIEKQQAPKYYENLEEFNNLKARYKDVMGTGDSDEAQKMLTEHPWLDGAELDASTKDGKAAQAGTFLKFARDNIKELKGLREQRDALYLDAELSVGERNRQALDIEKQMAELQKDFNRAMNAARVD